MDQERLNKIIEDPYSGIRWEKRNAQIIDTDGNIKFQEEVEFPDYFSDNDLSIVASKYLCNNAKVKETSFKDMIERVSNQMYEWGITAEYFESGKQADEFTAMLKYIQVHQMAAFNSPVYFNCGLYKKQQLSACFILNVEDSMESIFDYVTNEALIFKQGSGSGANLSNLRSTKERVRGGGFASGPVSFMKVSDVAAGVVKSGGTLRRSAKLNCLNIDHPDILKFINCKEQEEKKLRILKEAGIKPEEGYEMSDHVYFQNVNISVRLSDDFMRAVENNSNWDTKYVLNGKVCETYNARDIMQAIAEQAWKTGDPGVQFDDTFNRWNTVPNDGRINSTNPCSEFAFLDNSSCNLAAINLLQFFYEDSEGEIIFDHELFYKTVETLIMAQEIIVDRAFYPNEAITKGAHDYRPLGLGFSNLGGLLMYLGLPYDSEEARLVASSLTAIITGHAYAISGRIADVKGPFERFKQNQTEMYRVLEKHIQEVNKIFDPLEPHSKLINSILYQAHSAWDEVIDRIDNKGPFRNAQVSLVAPNGTTSFMMGCATFGIEPEYSLVRYKRLAGMSGGTMTLTNPVIRAALQNLKCYSEDTIDRILDFIKADNHLDNCDYIKDKHRAIFDCAATPPGGKRIIDYMGHIKMMQAVQPYISGSVSKTVNVPEDSTVEDIKNVYIYAWKHDLKSITIYRNNSKTDQVLSTVLEKKRCSERERPPKDRVGKIHKFEIGQIEGYLICGEYPDGRLCEIFVDVAKEGSTLSGLLDTISIQISLALQYGVPLKDIVRKLQYQNFEPHGITQNCEMIPFCTSIVDYVGRYIGLKYLTDEDKNALGLKSKSQEATEVCSLVATGPSCSHCGSLMTKKGSCFLCTNCGYNEGACS